MRREGQPDAGPVSVAKLISGDFCTGALDLSQRPGAPKPGWSDLPECVAVEHLQRLSAQPYEIRTFITFVATVDYSRDTGRLWACGARLFASQRWAFSPSDIVERPLSDLEATLKSSSVSQRHTRDVHAWYTVARSLLEAREGDPIYRVIHRGEGDAGELLTAVGAQRDGCAEYPLLKGPRTSAVWIRMLAFPGGAQISNLDILPVAVDVNVRRVGEYLGVTKTGGQALEHVRSDIQAAWRPLASEAVGPPSTAGTGAALDPALWFYGKWGCFFCEQRFHRMVPFGRACDLCRFPQIYEQRTARV